MSNYATYYFNKYQAQQAIPYYIQYLTTYILNMINEREYQILAQIMNNRVELAQAGMDVLDEFDFCSVVTVQGNLQCLPFSSGMSASSSPTLSSQGGGSYRQYQNCILIQKYPLFSSRLKRYIILLRIVANDERTMSLAHTICALISNVVIVSATEKSLNYLLAPGQIVSEKGNVQDKMAALVGVTEDGNASSPIIENLDSFSRILQSQNIQKPQLVSLYPFVTSYQLPQSNPMQQSSIQSSSLRQVHSFYPAMQSLLQDTIDHNCGNTSIIIHGEILCEYLMLISDQFNQQNRIMPSLAQDNIEVDEDFDSYLKVVDKYNTKCKNGLGADGQANMQAYMQKLRADVEMDDVVRNNPRYAKKMGIYMDRKQAELTELNDKFDDSYNLNLLQKQSAKSLDMVSNNRNLTHQDVAKQIERVTTRYNEKARGNNRHKLLTEFMQVFTPTMYAQAGLNQQIDQRISTLANENKNLQTEIAKLQKKKGKCCAIM